MHRSDKGFVVVVFRGEVCYYFMCLSDLKIEQKSMGLFKG